MTTQVLCKWGEERLCPSAKRSSSCNSISRCHEVHFLDDSARSKPQLRRTKPPFSVKLSKLGLIRASTIRICAIKYVRRQLEVLKRAGEPHPTEKTALGVFSAKSCSGARLGALGRMEGALSFVGQALCLWTQAPPLFSSGIPRLCTYVSRKRFVHAICRLSRPRPCKGAGSGVHVGGVWLSCLSVQGG
jgi:hypothetical protein